MKKWKHESGLNFKKSLKTTKPQTLQKGNQTAYFKVETLSQRMWNPWTEESGKQSYSAEIAFRGAMSSERKLKKKKTEEVTGLGWSNQFSLNLDTGKQAILTSSLSWGD